MNSERWQDHSEPPEWVNYWAIWLTCTIENKPSLDNDQHFLSPWMNAPQIAVFTVFVIRTPGQRCKATHQCCSSGTGWLFRAAIPYPRVLLCSISRVGWSWGESMGVTRLWDTLSPITAHPRSWQLCCAAAMVSLLNTAGSPIHQVSVWLTVLVIRDVWPGGFGWLAALYPKRKNNAKEVLTYAGNMTIVINPRLYRSSFWFFLIVSVSCF